MAFADVNTYVRRENTDVRCVGFLPPFSFIQIEALKKSKLNVRFRIDF